MSIEAVEAAVPNLNLTPEEKRVYGQLFRQADTESVGVVTGEVAVKFFEKTRLDSSILGEIWQIADQENRGFLTPAGFGLTLRLIGHAQAGRQPSREIALQQGPIPRFEGFTPAGPPVPPPQPSPLQAQGTGGAPIRIPPLTPEKVAQYASLFERQGLQGNLLPGDQAKSIFEKSALPNEVLGRIWQLADTEQRGSLVQTEFVIAMHLLTSMKTGALRGLPNVLPAALYEAATRRGSMSRQSPQPTGQPLSAIPRQLSGSAHMRPGGQMPRSPLNPQATGGLTPQMSGSGSDWAVTPVDKARFDQFYNDLDKTNKGFITGDEAVPFLSQSNLSEDALAQIWDLADINSEGRLTRDTFAVAMFLIRQQRTRRDGSNTVPTTLPPNLIPPSLRTQARPPTASGSPFDAPAPAPPQPPPAPKSALDDLFGLDSPAPPAPVQFPQNTGGSAAKDPFASASPMPPASPVRASPSGNTFRPFVPSSSFGRGLTAQDTGGSASSAGGPKPPAPMGGMDDLLGDNDPEISKKLTNETTELANLSNQIGSLSNQMQQVQATRTSTEKEINQTNQQKKNFETRLAQLRTAYENEMAAVDAMKQEKDKNQREVTVLMQQSTEIQEKRNKLAEEHNALLAEFQKFEAQNATLKQQISEANNEVAQLTPQIEKLRSESRRLKGMVAINSKQLATVEGQRDKLQAEARELSSSAANSPRGSTSSPVPVPAQVASPAPSNASANNPFFRRTGSTDMMGAFASPPVAKPYGDKSFDDIFGGFAPSSSSTPPPPATSFKQQHTGTSTASVGSFATPGTSSPTVSRQDTLTAEPPAPPLSRQMTPSFLPLGDMSESLTSSRQASPPMSRAGEPPAAAAQALEPTATGQSVASGADVAKTSDTEEKPAVGTDGVPIPGAFPEEDPKAVGESPFGGNRDSEIFESMKKEPVSAKDDFDSAFASFSGGSSSGQEKPKDTNNTFTKFDSEFPPISEINRDDEDSETASEGNGFDDDFAPVSPTTKKADTTEAPKAASPVEATKAAAEGSVGAGSSIHSTNAATASKEDDPFAPAADFAPAPGTVTNTAPPASKGAFDDLDDEFEGLEDAKEGSADDEFANISRSNLDDFNPVFDSSPPPSQPKNESSNASNAFGIDSSYDFGNVSTTSAGAPTISTHNTGAAAAGQGPKSPDNQEWDALFATLDEAPANNGTGESAAPKANEQPQSPVSPKSGLAPPRPENPGRALTEDGTHDDPILKNLTGMGYSRNDALNALEKYDYNLERAANHLANQS
ncbi:ef hand domain-containing protein [Apiospora marii]|uniref:Ef hand domain-containing protein n=1 Tax=Apiospora marii TaxID=335849 RepID=A0ABR1RFB8_9PEZI